VSRDKSHQRLATAEARRTEREIAVSKAKSQAERVVAQERLVNFRWEVRVENECLRGCEARMTLAAKQVDLLVVQFQRARGHIDLAKASLDLLQRRYRTRADEQEQALKKAVAAEEGRAAKSIDPLERFRANRQAAFYELERQLTQFHSYLASSPSPTLPTLDEQKHLADEAETEFANVKKLLDDGLISHLDALRLNNSFRRIGLEREDIETRDLAAVTRWQTYFENVLSDVEVELMNDARDDRFEFEDLREHLDKSRHNEAEKLCIELEATHKKLLHEKRRTLLMLANRAEQTHDQILRRLKILEDQYGFIRTHLILVRDREPIGATTFVQAQREVTRLCKGCCRLVLESCDRKMWGKTSYEFGAALAASVIMPWPFYRVRRLLRRRGRETLGSP